MKIIEFSIACVIIMIGYGFVFKHNNHSIKEYMEIGYFSGQIDYAKGKILIKKNEEGIYIWDKNSTDYNSISAKGTNPLYIKALEIEKIEKKYIYILTF